MLNLNDIIALAKQGYKPADVKELIELSKEADVSEEVPSEEIEEQISIPDAATSEEGGTSDDTEDSEKVVDYKKKAEELEKKIQDLQKANTRQNIADTDKKLSDSEAFAEVMKQFM